MADINMPSYVDYGAIQSMNPVAAGQAYDQIGLARQFADESYKQQQNSTQKGFLENQFAEQDNPNKVQERVLTNQGKDILNQGYALDNQGKIINNQTNGLTLAGKQDSYADTQAALHKHLALQMSDDDLATASNDVLRGMQKAKLSGNEDEYNRLSSIQDLLVGALGSKAADRTQKRQLAELEVLNHSNIAAGNNATSIRVAEINAEREKEKARMAAEWHTRGLEAHKNFQNLWTQVFNDPSISDEQKTAKLANIERAMQTAAPQYGAQFDFSNMGINRLGQGGKQLSEQELLDKYNK
jgi:hypothetical protein